MHIRNINLNKWFPENDKFAAGMAKLCILREDFLFELQGFVESHSVPIEDEYGTDWRQLYFFRRMCTTVKEVRNAIEVLSKESKEFKQFLKEQPTDLVKHVDSFKADLNRALKTIDTVRNEVSAHIKQSSIEQALNKMRDEQRSGVLQISFEMPAKTHYKFTVELLMAIMLKDVPPDNQEKEAKERVDKFIPAVQNLLEMINMIFSFYAKERVLGT